MIADNVSIIGTPAARSGTNIETTAAVLAVANKDAIPSKNPRVRDPESPIKILAGGKLKIKKPIHAPIIPSDNIAASALFWVIAKIKIVEATIVTIPAAKPSSPSIKLIIFANATRKNIVIGKLNQPNSINFSVNGL